MEEGYEGRQTAEYQDHAQYRTGSKGHAQCEFEYEPGGLKDIRQHMIASSFGRIHTRSRHAIEKPQGDRNNDQAKAAGIGHYESPHIIGVRNMIQVRYHRRIRGCECRNGIEQGIGVDAVMCRQEQRDSADERHDNPAEPGNRKRLLTRHTPRRNTDEPHRSTHNDCDSRRQQIARARTPFLEDQANEHGEQHDKTRKRNDCTQIMGDRPEVIDRIPLPHTPILKPASEGRSRSRTRGGR